LSSLKEHTSKNGAPKILKECSLPVTGKNCVDMIITEKGVFNVDSEKGLTLIEKAEDVSIEDIVQTTGCVFNVAEDLKPMQQV
jgi:3-oxoacid CoA-transferase